MHPTNASIRILRIAAWIWISFLIAMAAMDFALYSQISFFAARQSPQPVIEPDSFKPVYLFYAASGLVALIFLAFAHWGWVQKKNGKLFLPPPFTHHFRRACSD